MTEEKALFENIDINSSVAVYAQIMNQVQFAIASGRLKSGDRLPGVNELAERLDVHMNTVMFAYRDLLAMGIVNSRRGVGTHIREGVEAKCTEECRKKRIARLHEVVSEARAAGMTQKEIRDICSESYSADEGPYVPASKALLAKARKSPA